MDNFININTFALFLYRIYHEKFTGNERYRDCMQNLRLSRVLSRNHAPLEDLLTLRVPVVRYLIPTSYGA